VFFFYLCLHIFRPWLHNVSHRFCFLFYVKLLLVIIFQHDIMNLFTTFSSTFSCCFALYLFLFFTVLISYHNLFASLLFFWRFSDNTKKTRYFKLLQTQNVPELYVEGSFSRCISKWSCCLSFDFLFFNIFSIFLPPLKQGFCLNNTHFKYYSFGLNLKKEPFLLSCFCSDFFFFLLNMN
jgi:hypothetical protein